MSYSYKTEPFKHQLEALSLSATKKNFAYFMEMGCVDEETEFLTQRGWVKFLDFDLEKWERPLLVAQAIPKANDKYMRDWAFEFTEPLAYIKKPAYEWISCKDRVPSTEKDLLMTADHTLPVQYSWTNFTNGTVTPHTVSMPEATAQYLYDTSISKANRVPKYPTKYVKLRFNMISKANLGLQGFDSEHFVPDKELYDLSEWELRFMVAVIADGTFPNKTNNKCDIQVVKKRKAERLIMLAQRAQIPMAVETKARKYNRRAKVIHDTTYTFHFIAPMRCKVFDERWYSLDQKRLRIIASELCFWDGHISSLTKSLEFYSSKKESADFAQYAFFACGWSSSIVYSGVNKVYTVRAPHKFRYDDQIIKEIEPTTLIAPNDPTSYPLYSSLAPSSFKKIDEEKTAYCFRVPSGYLVLRRKDRIFISGNSGKTKVMIDNIGVLHDRGHITGALILAPKGVYRNWSEKEIPTHLPDSINREVLVWSASATDSQKNRLKKQIENWDGKTLQIMVFNIESLNSIKGKDLLNDFIRKHNSNILAIVDESTCIKNHKAKRTKAAIEIGQKCKARRIATGSPITNSPLDLYSQCAFLDKSLIGYGSYYAFKNTFADIERVQNRQGQHYDKIVRYKNLDILSDRLSKFSYRITKKECLDLPDKIYVTRDVELTPEQRQIYKDMYDSQFAILKDNNEYKEMSTSVILTKMLRLHQVLCGSFVADDGKILRIPNNRVEALKDVLCETSGKAIIWASYLADIEDIKTMLTMEYGAGSFVSYYGAVNSEDRVKAINLFQDPDSPVRFFLGNVQTAGRGITLTEASTVIYYSNNFSLELRQQSEDRAHRLGQKNKVTYVDLVVRNSLDEKIIRSLVEKRNIANEVLKDDLEEWITLNPASP